MAARPLRAHWDHVSETESGSGLCDSWEFVLYMIAFPLLICCLYIGYANQLNDSDSFRPPFSGRCDGTMLTCKFGDLEI